MGNRQHQKNKNQLKNINENNQEKEIIEEIEDIKADIYKFNILFVGESGVGTKTSLIKKILGNKYIDNKDIQKLIYLNNNKKYILHLIEKNRETDEKNSSNIYLNNASRFFKNADCIILGYDVTNEQSFQEIKNYWFKQIKDKRNTNLIYLVANKIDLKSKIKVKEDRGKTFADANNIKYFSISVKNNINIDIFMNNLKSDIENNIKNDINNGINEIFYGNPSKEYYKVVFVGDTGIGAKTSLINRIVNDEYNPNSCRTSGANYCYKNYKLKNGNKLSIHFWDTVGGEKFEKLTTYFLKNSDCIVLGFDITKKNT